MRAHRRTWRSSRSPCPVAAKWAFNQPPKQADRPRRQEDGGQRQAVEQADGVGHIVERLGDLGMADGLLQRHRTRRDRESRKANGDEPPLVRRAAGCRESAAPSTGSAPCRRADGRSRLSAGPDNPARWSARRCGCGATRPFSRPAGDALARHWRTGRHSRPVDASDDLVIRVPVERLLDGREPHLQVRVQPVGQQRRGAFGRARNKEVGCLLRRSRDDWTGYAVSRTVRNSICLS